MSSNNKTKYFNESNIMKAPLYCNLPHPDVLFSKPPLKCDLPHPDVLFANVVNNPVKTHLKCDLPHPDVLFGREEKDKLNYNKKATKEIKKLLNIK